MSTNPVPRQRVVLSGVAFDAVTETDVVDRVMGELDHGRGGRIITPNVDILRLVGRQREARDHVEAASVVVADGAPLIWASRLAGRPLPVRVPGSDLIWSLSKALGERSRSVFLFGGEPGSADKAADVLTERFPGLKVVGHTSPAFGFDTRPDEYATACQEVIDAQPDLVFVGLGFPKQERVIARLQQSMPRTWFMGCGAAIGFVAGTQPRAPMWMQRSGLEWAHRLGREPGRLMKRYLVHDMPFAARLLATSAISRSRSRTPSPRS